MNWSDQITRIRRWIRDPSANVFGEAFLLRLYNDEQQQLFGMLGPVLNVKTVRTHPEFFHGYTQEWEWAYTSHASGDVYAVGLLHDATETVYCNVWEAEILSGYDGESFEQGAVYTQPWEAWCISGIWFPPPIPLPSDFARAVFVAHDRDRIDPDSKRELIRNDDLSWKSRAGSAWSYWRDDDVNNWIRIYPLPTLTWQDTAETQADPDEAEYGSTTLDVDNNLLVVYISDPDEITGSSSESTLPAYFQKYVEYGVAERALRANTDGRIESLADYWGMRKKAGYEVIKTWKRVKMADRDIRLRTQSGSSTKTRPAYPRLPSTYPDNWV